MERKERKREREKENGKKKERKNIFLKLVFFLFRFVTHLSIITKFAFFKKDFFAKCLKEKTTKRINERTNETTVV